MKADDYNYPIVINLDQTGWTDDHWILEEISAKKMGDKYMVSCKPIDVRLGRGVLFPKGHEELKKRYEKLLEKGNRKVISLGSKHRDIIMYEPDDPNNYPEAIKNTNIGLFISMAAELRKNQDMLQQVLREQKLSETQIMSSLASGEINDWMYRRLENQMKAVVQVSAQEAVSKALATKKEDKPDEEKK